MPTDKLTLTSLGLPHGPPAWWRRANQPVLRPIEQPTPTLPPVSHTQQALQGNWRRQSPLPAPQVPSASYERKFAPVSPIRDFGYGPIAPPSRSASSGQSSNSAGGVIVRSPVDVKEDGEIDEDDDMLFKD
jgi:hypothetical protein